MNSEKPDGHGQSAASDGGSQNDLLDALLQEMPWYVSAAVRYHIAIADQLQMPVSDVHAIGALLEFGPIGVRRLADLMGTRLETVVGPVGVPQRGDL